MKILSKMLSKKPTPNQSDGKIELDMDVEPLRRRDAAVADDSGEANASISDDPLFADPSRPVRAKGEAPDPAPNASADDWDDEEWDDEDWGDEEDEEWSAGDEFEEEEPDPKAANKAMLVEEIREAVGAVSHVEPEDRSKAPKSKDGVDDRPFKSWADDEEFGRKGLARSAMTGGADAEDRMFEKTDAAMTDRETSRRRSAMAHLKAAAAATKADRVLSKVASRDPSSDPEEQSPYRDDLAKVVRPHSKSRPISRQVSRPTSATAAWDTGAADDDAAFYAASGGDDKAAKAAEEELAAAEAERLARAPLDLSEDEFAGDSPFETRSWADEPVTDEPVTEEEPEMEVDAALNEPDFADEGGFEDEFEFDDEPEDDDEPVPSNAVAEAVAIGRGEYDDDPEEDAREEEATRKKIWEMADEVAADLDQRRKSKGPENFAAVSSAVVGRGGRAGAGRVKTRLIGFQADIAGPRDVFEESAQKSEAQPSNARRFPAGWIVVTDGPGRGASFTLYSGVSQIGRGEEQAVRLDFGDLSISRNNHAAVAFDDEQGTFFLGHGGKSNLVRLNGRPVLSTEEMENGDEIRIGETTLKFIALCGAEFTWKQSDEGIDDGDE